MFQKEIDTDDGQAILQIWDTAGQERYEAITSGFYRGADCCILVYDVTNRQSFDRLDWKTKIINKMTPQNNQRFPFLVIANKTDLDGRQISALDGKRFC